MGVASLIKFVSSLAADRSTAYYRDRLDATRFLYLQPHDHRYILHHQASTEEYEQSYFPSFTGLAVSAKTMYIFLGKSVCPLRATVRAENFIQILA